MAGTIVNMHAAKTQLSQLVARAERGERITIARDGKPVAQLGPAPHRGHALRPPDDPLLNGIRLECIVPLRFEPTKRFFRQHVDHACSVTDCSSFVVMRELRLTQALTTDGQFPEADFETLLSVR